MATSHATQDNRGPARLIAGGATLLSISVLADSVTEHYRGSFRDPFMVLPVAASIAAIAFNARETSGRALGKPETRTIGHVGGAAIGALGLGFHLYNITKRPGGLSLENLFYAAPIGAPGALILAGALGQAADAVSTGGDRWFLGLGSGRAIGALAAAGIIGTVGEAALFHFRGAFHDPFMWAPLIVPPVAAVSLLRDVSCGTPREATMMLLGATALLGFVGFGFHTYGVSRNMGGWRNWRQNVFAGPPLPAPPAFTGLAIAAIGALLLMRRKGSDG